MQQAHRHEIGIGRQGVSGCGHQASAEAVPHEMDANGGLCGADPPEQVGDTFAAHRACARLHLVVRRKVSDATRGGLNAAQ